MLDGLATLTLGTGALMGGAMIGLGFQSWRRVTRRLLRADSLKLAGDLLRTHQEQLELVFESPDVSDVMRTRLFRIVEAFEDRDQMLELTRGIKALADTPNPASHSDLDTRLDELPPSVRDAFISCVVTGLLGTILRWPETAESYLALSTAALKRPAEMVRGTAEASTKISLSRPIGSPVVAGRNLMPA